jgi:hypothetical protein
MPRLLALAAVSAALTLGGLVLPNPGAAQQAQATISGTISLATPGDTLPAGVEVQLIALDQDQDITSVSQQADAGGAFTFEVDADARFSYIPFLIYEGVRYLSDPIRFDASTTTATVAFEVYSTTTEAPDLSIESTIMVAVSLQRSTSSIVLLREDIIERDELTVYVGGEDGVTLRIPVPDRTTAAGGVDEDDPDFSFEGGTVNVSIPLRPGRNSIVTSYTVGYDAIEDMYRLRITSPLPTDDIEARVPDAFVSSFEPQTDGAQRTADSEFEGETILAIERIGPATPGQGLVVNLEGLSGAAPAHVFTTTTGAIVGSLLALATIAALAITLARRDTEAPA